MYSPPSFPVTEDGLKDAREHLNVEGYVLLSGIFGPDLETLKYLFIKDLQQINPKLNITPDELFTQKMDCDYPGGRLFGLLGEYGLCHGEAAWEVRTHSKVLDSYAAILDIPKERLICSFDSIGYSTSDCETTEMRWLHTDQPAEDKETCNLKSFQGIYYATETNEYTATTAVIPGTHHVVRSQTSIDQERDWDKTVRLKIPADTLLIFNSKLIHQGWHGPNRLCFMICYSDKLARTEQSRQMKIYMYIHGLRSTHWSQFPRIHGPKHVQRLENKEFHDLVPRLTGIPSKGYYSDIDELIPSERLALF